MKQTKKGVYCDGHEREDVVRDRQNRFIPEIMSVIENSVWFEEVDGEFKINNDDADYILISQDEKAHKSNEQISWYLHKSILNPFYPIYQLCTHPPYPSVLHLGFGEMKKCRSYQQKETGSL